MAIVSKAVAGVCFVALCAAHVLAATCAPVSIGGGSVDLSQIQTTTLLKQQQYSGGAPVAYFDWQINFCQAQSACTGSTADGNYFLAQLNAGSETCSNALFNTMTSAPTAVGKNINIMYTDMGNRRIANVTLSCGGTVPLSSSTNTFTTSTNAVTSVTMFYFNWQSPLLCVSEQPAANSLSWGGVFLILFFVGLFLYAAAAVGFNYYKGMRGKDLAPHPDFWKSLPSLFLDGVKFTAAKALALCGKGDGSFTPSGGGASASSTGAATGYSAI